MSLSDKIHIPCDICKIDNGASGITVIFTEDVREAVKEFEQILKNNKQIHNLDDCECCENSAQTNTAMLKLLNEKFGEKLTA